MHVIVILHASEHFTAFGALLWSLIREQTYQLISEVVILGKSFMLSANSFNLLDTKYENKS